MRRGFSMIELLVPLLTLSTQAVEDHQDLLERSLVQGLCMDVVSRFKAYKPFWPMPGARGGPKVTEMYLPMEIDPAKATLFDSVYLEQMKALRMRPQPKIVVTSDERKAGLFRIDVSIEWKSLKGKVHRFEMSRYCYQP